LFDGVTAVATPKQIRELMKVDGLRNDEVKGHLQVGSNSPLFSFQIPPKIYCPLDLLRLAATGVVAAVFCPADLYFRGSKLFNIVEADIDVYDVFTCEQL
jgi:hypothetical protein